ncbi:Holliday junction resolvase RuvX [Haploplasma modicum]|uniref:Holliday junction resolvase RuvX n=1 Tax=Haploplasma modicum TaxID=2150 RepID=UPI00214BC9E1|nr:Holliday junction resolvase RuvX [Haploplasma modicum]MCR1809233.1 Holliday junction resolvase RuvX [Haploplasma modicum]
MKKYLGIDLGSKSLGFSISLSGIIANSYQTLYFKDDNYEEAISLTVEVIKKEQITDVVIGLPKHMNNDLGIRGQISIDFANMLKSKIDVNVVLWDERTSTQSAIKAMVSQNVSRKKQKMKKDELAATIILQNYLDYKEKN